MLSGVRKMFGSNGPINCGRWSLIWWLRSCFLSIKWGRTLALAARTLSPSPVARSLSPVAGTLTSTQWIPTRILHRRPVSSPPSSALLPHLPHRHAFPARISGGSGSSRQRRDLPARIPRSGDVPSRRGPLVAAARNPPGVDPSSRRRGSLPVRIPHGGGGSSLWSYRRSCGPVPAQPPPPPSPPPLTQKPNGIANWHQQLTPPPRASVWQRRRRLPHPRRATSCCSCIAPAGWAMRPAPRSRPTSPRRSSPHPSDCPSPTRPRSPSPATVSYPPLPPPQAPWWNEWTNLITAA
jgi:hypothetical protein